MGVSFDPMPKLVERHKVQSHASMRDVTNELATWTDRAVNNAADEAAKAALAAQFVAKEAGTRFERMDTVDTMAAKWVGYHTAVAKVRNEAGDTLAERPPHRRQSKTSPADRRPLAQVATGRHLPRWDGLAAVGLCLLLCYQPFCCGAGVFRLQEHCPLGHFFRPTVVGAFRSVCSPLTVSGGVEAGSAARGAESPLDALAGSRLFARARGPRHFTVARHACAAVSRLHASWGPLCFCLVSVRSVYHLPPRWTNNWLIGTTLCWMCSAKTFAKKVLACCWASSGWLITLLGIPWFLHTPLECPERHETAKQHRLIREAVGAVGVTLSSVIGPTLSEATAVHIVRRSRACAQCQDQRQASFGSSSAAERGHAVCRG